MTEVAENNFESSATRETLLDVVLDRLNKSGTGKTVIFTRVIYVARFNKREQGSDTIKGIFCVASHYRYGVHGVLLLTTIDKLKRIHNSL